MVCASPVSHSQPVLRAPSEGPGTGAQHVHFMGVGAWSDGGNLNMESNSSSEVFRRIQVVRLEVSGPSGGAEDRTRLQGRGPVAGPGRPDV